MLRHPGTPHWDSRPRCVDSERGWDGRAKQTRSPHSRLPGTARLSPTCLPGPTCCLNTLPFACSEISLLTALILSGTRQQWRHGPYTCQRTFILGRRPTGKLRATKPVTRVLARRASRPRALARHRPPGHRRPSPTAEGTPRAPSGTAKGAVWEEGKCMLPPRWSPRRTPSVREGGPWASKRPRAPLILGTDSLRGTRNLDNASEWSYGDRRKVLGASRVIRRQETFCHSLFGIRGSFLCKQQ